MSTALLTPTEAPAAPRPRTAPAPIPFTRLVGVELRKMFDTRSGRWLLITIAALALVATAAVIAFAPAEFITFESFATAVGVPAGSLLPIVAILAVTSEWSQRTGLTSFTLVPRRGRVLGAKLVATVLVGVVVVPVMLAIGSLGNLLGAAIHGIDPVWDTSAQILAQNVAAFVLVMLIGFTLGVLIRNSPGAIVAYFVYSLVLPGLLAALAAFQEWFRDIHLWVDFNMASTVLYDEHPTGEQWAQLGVSGLIWLVIPLALGLWLVRRSEVK
ncbi:ABC transporter permease subunit [Nocardioides limicola]|uniref:ABC transporter permease subunit n=1 Tax=Nocardioides limicola TaxID=2803368 RepID=UPI00193B1048|nr:ABC transporter permease subunit [Nocardioides sp. DJM-14]